MGEKEQKKIESLSNILSKLKDISNEQRTLIEHMAGLQVEMENMNESSLSDKVAEIFSNESKNQEVLKSLIEDTEIKLNQLKSEG